MLKNPELVKDEILHDMYGKLVMKRHYRGLDDKISDFLIWGAKTKPSIIFPLTDRLEVVYINQFRRGVNQFVIELPGGCPKADEGFEEITRQELLEETGYQARGIVKLGPSMLFEPAACITKYTPVLALGCKKVQKMKLDETEVIERRIAPLKNWIDMIRCEKVIDNKTIAVTFLALLRLGFVESIF